MQSAFVAIPTAVWHRKFGRHCMAWYVHPCRSGSNSRLARLMPWGLRKMGEGPCSHSSGAVCCPSWPSALYHDWQNPTVPKSVCRGWHHREREKGVSTGLRSRQRRRTADGGPSRRYERRLTGKMPSIAYWLAFLLACSFVRSPGEACGSVANGSALSHWAAALHCVYSSVKTLKLQTDERNSGKEGEAKIEAKGQWRPQLLYTIIAGTLLLSLPLLPMLWICLWRIADIAYRFLCHNNSTTTTTFTVEHEQTLVSFHAITVVGFAFRTARQKSITLELLIWITGQIKAISYCTSRCEKVGTNALHNV